MNAIKAGLLHTCHVSIVVHEHGFGCAVLPSGAWFVLTRVIEDPD